MINPNGTFPFTGTLPASEQEQQSVLNCVSTCSIKRDERKQEIYPGERQETIAVVINLYI